ncbi:MAG: Dihydroorotase [Acidobacteriales bacterium]|nr:Dihydroorotase [Terriglobales bacterium]
MTRPLLIRGGHLIDPPNNIDASMDILLRDGRVAEVAAPGKIPAKDFEIFDAKGLIVSPGLIDIHVHLRQPGQEYKETIATGTAAAAAGGFTSVCCMPNTVPVNDTPEITAWMQSAERGAIVNVFPIAAATAGSMGVRLTDFTALKNAGAVGFTDDGKPILHDDIMRASLQAAAKLSVPVIQHAEDTRLTGGCSMNLGPTSFRLGLRGMSIEAESGIVERDIRLAQETGGHIHVAHLSTAKALDAVRRAKRDGIHVTCEVTPHHFTLLDEHVGAYDTNFKMNPPLRAASDREAMLEGLLDGTIDAIATDHAPHALHEKEQEFDRAPMGITGLETALAITLQVLHHHRKAPLKRVIELMSATPARLVGLKDRGTLSRGAHADITIFDPKKKWKFEAQTSRSKSKNTPFDGWEFTGAVVATIVSGKLVYRRDSTHR